MQYQASTVRSIDIAGQPGSPRILVGPAHAPRPGLGDGRAAWRLVGWLAGVLLTAGLVDVAIALYPARFGSPDWEFGTIVSIFSGLPLVSLGAFGLAASASGSGSRVLAVASAVLLVALGLGVTAGTAVFLLDVPIALSSVAPGILVGVKKAIAKTLLLGTLFGISYFIAAFLVLRHSRDNRRK